MGPMEKSRVEDRQGPSSSVRQVSPVRKARDDRVQDARADGTRTGYKIGRLAPERGTIFRPGTNFLIFVWYISARDERTIERQLDQE